MLLKYFYGRWQCSTACSWSAASCGGRNRQKPELYKKHEDPWRITPRVFVFLKKNYRRKRMAYLVLCHTDEVELFGGDGHREVLLGRLCELDPDGAVRQVVVPAGLCGLPAIADDELGKLLPIHAGPECALFLADQLQGKETVS